MLVYLWHGRVKSDEVGSTNIEPEHHRPRNTTRQTSHSICNLTSCSNMRRDRYMDWYYFDFCLLFDPVCSRSSRALFDLSGPVRIGCSQECFNASLAEMRSLGSLASILLRSSIPIKSISCQNQTEFEARHRHAPSVDNRVDRVSHGPSCPETLQSGILPSILFAKLSARISMIGTWDVRSGPDHADAEHVKLPVATSIGLSEIFIGAFRGCIRSRPDTGLLL